MSAKEAKSLAQAKGVDLVKIAPQAKPPVVKIMDYSKYRYEQAKREKENRKKQKRSIQRKSDFPSTLISAISTPRSIRQKNFFPRAIRSRFPFVFEAERWLIPSLVKQICSVLQMSFTRLHLLIRSLNLRAGRYLCFCRPKFQSNSFNGGINYAKN